MVQGSQGSDTPSQPISEEAVLEALSQARLTLDNAIQGMQVETSSLERLQNLPGRARFAANSGCNNTSCGDASAFETRRF